MESIAFILPEVRIGACGVSDYSMRMAATLSGMGFRCSLLATESVSGPQISDGVTIGILDPENALNFDLICVQYVPDLKAVGRRFLSRLAALRHPRVHLMIHEFFRISSSEHPLRLRERIKSRLQLRQLRSLIQKIRPRTLSTSNDHYRRILLDYGILTNVSPMPGTISFEREELEPTEIPGIQWFRRENGDFIWVVFGNLYTDFWDCAAYFEEISRVSAASGRTHRWVICGRQAEGEESRFRQAAAAAGFETSIVFTGSLPGSSVDWFMRRADASLSGTGGEFWQKSTGVLVALERGLPIYFPRDKNRGRELGEPTLYHDLERLLRDHVCSGGSPVSYEGPHTPSRAAGDFLKIVGCESSP